MFLVFVINIKGYDSFLFNRGLPVNMVEKLLCWTVVLTLEGKHANINQINDFTDIYHRIYVTKVLFNGSRRASNIRFQISPGMETS